MASMAGRAENDEGQQQLYRKPRRNCGGCCASCCTCCIQFVSGLIFLLLIAALVLSARIFLEFPVILNGFASTVAFTEQTTDIINMTSDSASVETSIPPSTSAFSYRKPHEHIPQNRTCLMFVGSFQLLNETYQLQYNNISSNSFQSVATRIKTTISVIFENSLLKASYRNSSVFSLSPNPFMVHFQLLFCNDSEIGADTVEQILRSSNGSLEKGNIAMDSHSVTVGGEAPCPTSLDLSRAWRWQAILQENQVPICMGSLLTGLWILSSAGCVKNRDPSLLSVFLASDSSSKNTTWKVDRVIQHPNFPATPDVNNIALIHLSEPVWFSASLMPICLPQTLQDPGVGSPCATTAGNILDVSTGGLMNVGVTVTAALNCVTNSQYGTIYISSTQTQLNQVDRGNSLICIGTDSLVYLQGIVPYQQNSSSPAIPCLFYTSIGPDVEWIKSYILA